MTYLIIALLMQINPPPVTPQPVINPCENMIPYEGAIMPDEWTLPDGTVCSIDDVEDTYVPSEGTPPAPVARPSADPFILRILDALNRAHRGW